MNKWAPFAVRAVRLFAVGDLVAHAGLEHDDTAVLELGTDLALEAQHDVPLLAPVIGDVAGRVVDHADAYLAELTRAPQGEADDTGMFARGTSDQSVASNGIPCNRINEP